MLSNKVGEILAVRHNSDSETVLLLYLAYSVTTEHTNVITLTISWSKVCRCYMTRVLQLSKEEANRGTDKYENEGNVRPSTLRDQLFITGNLDNIDHNPSSTLSRDPFHGTAISITHHITNSNPGVVRVLQEIPENRAQPK